MPQYGSSYSPYFCIKTGVPQSSNLSPNLFNICTAELPITTNTTITTYADDIAILCPSSDLDEISNFLQNHLDSIDNWTIKWWIKINPESIYVPFTIKRTYTPPVYFQDKYSNSIIFRCQISQIYAWVVTSVDTTTY